MELICLGNFGSGPYEEQMREIILNLDQHFRRCFFFLKILSIFSFGGHYEIILNYSWRDAF